MVSADYGRQYDDYWSREDRRGESSGDLDRVAEQIVACCGPGPVLDIGSGEGRLVATLLARGIDARGIDVSAVVVARANERIPGRFSVGSVLKLPYPDGAFDTVASTDCLEHLKPEDVPAALAEMARVSRRSVFLQIATTQDRDGHWHLTVEGRAWWEARCFEAGLRKHPRYYRVNDFEALNHDGWQVTIPLEKMPGASARTHPIDSLRAERDLHMDMLRDTGERSDAHVSRYTWASGYLKPGDRVLDAACGLGYGAHVLATLGERVTVLGIDGSESAIGYATGCYGSQAVSFREGFLPQALDAFPPGSFEAVVSFETLEHVEDPQGLLDAFRRVLVPGGRVIVSVPHDWSDETGRDPNPHHLHVYDWDRLVAQVKPGFILEDRFAETASRAKVAARGKAWEARPRSLRRIAPGAPAPDSEWCLLTAMKSPLEEGVAYEERVFANVPTAPGVSMQGYRYPWLAHAMINFTHRLREPAALERLADEVMRRCAVDTPDHGAALCVKAYRVLGRAVDDPQAVNEVVGAIEARDGLPAAGGVALRWRVSNAFVRAKLLQARGDLAAAREAFAHCGRLDVRGFGVHLATKTTEAWFQAGRLALALGDRKGAASDWWAGVDLGGVLLSTPLADILLAREWPNRFNHGDGVREFALAWDSIARCANGLHLLARGGELDMPALEASFQHEYGVVTRDLLTERGVVVPGLRETVRALQAALAAEQSAVADRSRDLEGVRAELAERGAAFEHTIRELADRDAGLRRQDATIAQLTRDLSDRDAVVAELTRDLEEVRRELAARTARLEEAVAHPWKHAIGSVRRKG